MKKATGRKSAWDTKVKPRLQEVEAWLQSGMLEKDCIKMLGISKETWYKLKRENSDFADLISRSRIPAIDELEKESIRSAKGYYYEEEKLIIKLDKDGNPKKVGKEIYKKWMPPNAQMQKFLLSNWASDRYSKDPTGDKIREEELKLRKMKIEEADW